MPQININPPRVYTCSPSWTPLPPPSSYCPSGSSQCTIPVHLSWVRKIPWRRAWQPTPMVLHGESMNRRAWVAIVHRVTQHQTRLKQLSTTRTHIFTVASAVTFFGCCCCCLVAKSCPNLCNPVNCSTPALLVLYQHLQGSYLFTKRHTWEWSLWNMVKKLQQQNAALNLDTTVRLLPPDLHPNSEFTHLKEKMCS